MERDAKSAESGHESSLGERTRRREKPAMKRGVPIKERRGEISTIKK